MKPKHRLLIHGSQPNQEAVRKELTKLGYQEPTCLGWDRYWLDTYYSPNKYPEALCDYTSVDAQSLEKMHDLPVTELNADTDKELILALACQQQGEELHMNEWVVIQDTENVRKYGCKSSIGQLFQLRPYKHNVEILGLKPAEENFREVVSRFEQEGGWLLHPTNQWGTNYLKGDLRKATKEDLFRHFGKPLEEEGDEWAILDEPEEDFSCLNDL